MEITDSRVFNQAVLLSDTGTEFIYKISDVVLSDSEVDELNSLSKTNLHKAVNDIFHKVYKRSQSIIYSHTENLIFNNNLRLIDSYLPTILSKLILQSYTSSNAILSNLVEEISVDNPFDFNFQTSKIYYRKKVKEFLFAISNGFVPYETWFGINKPTIKYEIQKDNSNTVNFDLYSIN